MKFVRATHTRSWASGYPLAYSLEEGDQVHLSRIKLECSYMSVDTTPWRMRLEIVKGVVPQKRAHYIGSERGGPPDKAHDIGSERGGPPEKSTLYWFGDSERCVPL